MSTTTRSHRILIVEDDASFASRLVRNLDLDGFSAVPSQGPEHALELLAQEDFDAVLCDVRMPGMSGLDLLSAVREGARPGVPADIPILMLTSVNSVSTAVDAMRRGASDYLTKEASRAEIAVRLSRVLDQQALANENRLLRATVAKTDEFSDLVGDSPAMQRIKQDIADTAPTPATVLILGETGVGKELVARAIHRSSGRPGAFIDVNAALLPDDTMLQSELFGHERGSFTDAKSQKRGKLELADRGTLFLDEIGELSPEAQAKLLRVLETMTFTRLGGSRQITVDVRVVTATNRDLLEECKAGRFREDLYYRLNVLPIEIPPLRKRPEDIPQLAEFFLRRAAERYSRPEPKLSDDALALLRAYAWPGNIRELRNVCERLLIRARGGSVLTASDVQGCGVDTAPPSTLPLELPEQGLNLDELERQLVLEALRKSNWRQTEAAQLLGISVDRMNSRVKKFGFTHPKWRVNK